MTNLAQVVQSLSRLKHTTGELLACIKDSRTCQSMAYQRLCELAEQIDEMLFLYKSKADIHAGRTRDARRAIESLRKRR